MSYLSLNNVSKKYCNGNKELVIFDNFNFSIKKNQFITVFGPNGCGKTTLLSLISGLVEPEFGTVLIDGSPPKKKNIGFLFQNYSESLFPWKTALENIAFPLEVRGVSKAEAKEIVIEFIHEMGLLNLIGYENHYIYQLSGGLQQLVALARSLIYRPDVLLLDEPFGSLDYQNSMFAQDKLLSIWRKTKITIILISHNINDAIYLGEKIVLLSKKPTRIVKTLDNNLPDRTDQSALMTQEATDLKKRIYDIFLREILV